MSPKKRSTRSSARRRAAKPARASAKQAALQVETYFASQPPDARRELRKMRAMIRAAAPGAVETFSYRMPGFRLDDRSLVWYAAWREHTSLYPITGAIRRAHAAELKGYGTSTGTVRFPRARPLPSALVKRLVRARVAELRKNART